MMRDPTGQEEDGRRLREIERVESGGMKEIANVIEGHDNHGEAAQEIDGVQPDRFGLCHGTLESVKERCSQYLHFLPENQGIPHNVSRPVRNPDIRMTIS
jgi:hypothetical protein